MTTTISVEIRCDQRDNDGRCGSIFRHRATGDVRQIAAGYGWQLGDPDDLCPRCASRAAATADPGQVRG